MTKAIFLIKKIEFLPIIIGNCAKAIKWTCKLCKKIVLFANEK
ncbi:hypothetical protein P615_00510 [Brevibacillus laterosporus PE36]|nr:hypothetical protein P615_00510 [Brevibacillus laterosporus PE36]